MGFSGFGWLVLGVSLFWGGGGCSVSFSDLNIMTELPYGFLGM